jgi:hypothetical protein
MSATVELARAHIDAVVARCPEAAAYDRDAWTAAVLAHAEPLPADRAWRRLSPRTRLAPVAFLAPAVARRLSPPVGTRPQPQCPAYCQATHCDDAKAA